MSSILLISFCIVSAVSCLQCVRNSPEEAEKMVQCEDNPEREFVKNETEHQDMLEYYCFGVWEQRTEGDGATGTIMKRAGCLASSRQARTHQACAETECVAITTQDVIYCCCNTTLCNNQFRYNTRKTTTTSATTTTETTTTATNIKKYDMQTWVEVLAIVSILCIVGFLVKQRCWKHSHSEGKEENVFLNSNV